MHEERITFPRTRQGVRDLDRVEGPVLPVSGGPVQRSTGVNVGNTERLLSAVGGGMLALTGLRSGALGLPALLIGAALLYRGVTGRCSMYQAFGINTAEAPVETSEEIAYRPD